MGSVASTDIKQNKRIWPIKNFNHVVTAEDMIASRYDAWNPMHYYKKFEYPAKEPEKDF